MKSFLLLVTLFMSQATFAHEAWDSCYSHNADLAIEEGQLVSTTGDQWDMALGQLLSSSAVDRVVEYCTLANAGTEVLAIDDTLTIETYEVFIEGERHVVEFECSRGYSEIPQNDNCVDGEWINE